MYHSVVELMSEHLDCTGARALACSKQGRHARKGSSGGNREFLQVEACALQLGLLRSVLTCIISAALLVACTTPEARQRAEVLKHQQYLERQARLTTVDARDGISEVEAYKIGRSHFDTYGTACGVVSTPVDLGDYWSVTTFPGFAGIAFEDILIRKSDGETLITKTKGGETPR